MKAAIVCDWLTSIGGAERVVLELHKMFPDAPIYTSQYDSQKINWFEKADVRTGWLQKLPAGLKKFLPIFRAWYFSHLDLSEYDLVISSSGAEAKGIKVKRPGVHVNYCHAPTHYYWGRYDEYMKNPGFGIFDPLARLGLKLLVGPLRRWDLKAAQRPDYMIANSNFTKDQIKKYYGRDSVVIHPPVDIERFKILNKSSISRKGFLVAGRQTPYKRIDLAVAACTKLDLPLIVIGDGPDHKKLVKMAGQSVKFVVGASDQEVIKYFRSAEAFIFPGTDDFGIVAVEALAAGTPVIAYKAGKTGEFFTQPAIAAIESALKNFKLENYNHDQIQKAAASFTVKQFHTKMTRFINSISAGTDR
jgi:glycosyltransferase involved in cell wall biosynthesis